MTSVETKLALMHKDIKYIKQEIIGNGKTGLIKRVTMIEALKNKVLGGLVVVGILASSSLTIIIIKWIWG